MRQPREPDNDKPWLIAEGFQPFGKNDDPRSERTLELPSKLFIPATSERLDLFLLQGECQPLLSKKIQVRRLIKDTSIFCAPHVVVAQGFSSIAFADFPVSFRHALRGITGPVTDRALLIFLAAYLRSPLARYYLFHTSSLKGFTGNGEDIDVERQK